MHTATKIMKQTIEYDLELPEKVTASIDNGIVTIKGEKGEVTRDFRDPGVSMTVKGNVIAMVAKDATKREKKRMFTYRAHMRNMMRGVNNPHSYKVKICSGHFPMNVTANNGELVVKNFLGEKHPRKIKLTQGVQVKVDGDVITCIGVDKEAVAQCAANMEQLTRITNRDRRIFQDGLYIIEKDGVALE